MKNYFTAADVRAEIERYERIIELLRRENIELKRQLSELKDKCQLA